MKSQIIDGYVYGTGAAINVELGFYPDRVTVTNLTDGDLITDAYMAFVAAFTSGGTATISEGDVLVGATSGAKARVRKIVTTSGSFAAGNLAGSFIFYRDSMVGTFQNEAVYVYQNSTGSVDDATLTAAPAVICTATATAVAAATGNAAISHYTGSSGSASKGFTIGSTVSESGKLLHWEARRSEA